MELHLRFCQLFFGIILPSCLLLYECRKLEGYKFPVYSTELCPRNQTEWNERSVALNCTDKNGYLCLPNENITELLEFCYEGSFIWIEENVCLFLRKGLSALFSYSCIGFQFGCPNSSFPSHELYKNPYCTLIGHGCFLAEPSCQRSTSTTYLENVTEHIQSKSSSTSTTYLENVTEHIQSKSREWALVGTTFGVFIVTFFCLTCFIFIINGKGYQILKQNTNEENNKKEELPPSSSPNTLVFNEISAEGHKMCKLTNDDENHDKEKLSPSHSTTALVLNEIRAEEYQNNDEENHNKEEFSPLTTPHSLVRREISAEGHQMFKQNTDKEDNKKEELPPSSSPSRLVFNEISAKGHKMCKLNNDDENHDKEELSPSHSTTALILNEIRAEGHQMCKQNIDGQNHNKEKLSPSTTPNSLVLNEISAEDKTRTPGTWTESLDSPDLQKLFGSFNVQIPDDPSKCSFAKILLEEIGLDEFIKEIKSLAWRVVLCNNFKDTGTKPGSVYVFEVFVKHVENQIVIEEKNGGFDLLGMKNADIIKVILIRGCLSDVSEAKTEVYKKYNQCPCFGNCYLQHESEQYIDISKLSAHTKIKSYEHRVELLCESIPLKYIENIAKDALDINFSKEKIAELCNKVVIEDFSGSQPSSTIEDIKCEIIKKTMQSFTDCLISKISADILNHIEKEMKHKMDPDLFRDILLFSAEALFKGTLLLLRALTIPFAALIYHISKDLGEKELALTVNSSSWRRNVATEIYNEISEKKENILDQISSPFKQRCETTKEHLKIVADQLKHDRRRIYPTNLTTINLESSDSK